VTTVARTLLDIAATERNQLERAFNEAEYRRLWTRLESPTCSAAIREEPGRQRWRT
jgi:hypothetical protein